MNGVIATSIACDTGFFGNGDPSIHEKKSLNDDNDVVWWEISMISSVAFIAVLLGLAYALL